MSGLGVAGWCVGVNRNRNPEAIRLWDTIEWRQWSFVGTVMAFFLFFYSFFLVRQSNIAVQ